MPRQSRYDLACCAILLYSCMLGQVNGDDQVAEQGSAASRGDLDNPAAGARSAAEIFADSCLLRYSSPATPPSWYYRAVLLMPREKERRFGDTQSKWMELSLEQFPKEEARKWLGPYRNTLNEVARATLREHCDWDLQVRQLKGDEALSLLLPDLQELRELARAMRVKSRLEIAEGRFDDAHNTLIMGYRLATNLSGSPILIRELVAVAIAGLMNTSVTDWINAGGPNLYWGLASLPTPLVDIRTALQQEMQLPLQMFPFLKDPESVSYTPQQWRQLIGESLQQMGPISGSGPQQASDLLAQTMATGMILAGYPSAKKALIDDGMDAKQVEAMPVGQVVAVRTARVCRKVYHESMKWTLLPYWQSYRQMRISANTLREEGYLGSYGQMPGVIPIASLFLPAIESAVLAPVRMQRDIAALQVIEAVRMAAADADGKLPSSLSDMQKCPAPRDPVTGAPFIYKVEGGKAVLELPPPEGKSAETFGKRYEITLEAQQ